MIVNTAFEDSYEDEGFPWTFQARPAQPKNELKPPSSIRSDLLKAELFTPLFIDHDYDSLI
jgi:hypothetical protein